MYCRKCGHELTKGSTFCTKCGSSTDPRRDRERLKKKEEERKEKEKKRIKEKKGEYSNNPAVLGFMLSSVSFLLVVSPTGAKTQTQWWYLALVFVSALAGIFFALKGQKIDDALDRKYRIRVHPRLIKTSFFLSGLVLLMWIFVMFQLFTGNL